MGILVFITSQEGASSPPSIQQPAIAASLDVADVPQVKRPQVGPCLAILASCLIITILTWATTRSYEKVTDILFENGSTRSLIGFIIYARITPLLVTLLIIAFGSALLMPVYKFSVRRAASTPDAAGVEQVNLDVHEGMTGSLASCGNPPLEQRGVQVHFAKPDLHREIEQEAKLGPLEVQVCGPERLATSVAQVTNMLKLQGHQVEVDIHNSAL